MTRSGILVGGMLLAAGMLVGPVAQAQKEETGKHYELAELMERAKVSLAQGLTASKAQGIPISGKFEVEDGKLQLSVYTMKSDTFSEVIINHQSGTVAKVGPITGGEDLTAAKAQRAVLTTVRGSLEAAVEHAIKANPGFAAVSVMPSLKEGRSVADVTLINDEGEELKTVSEPLS